MTSKLFAPGTVIDSPWLNDVNDTVYDIIGNGVNIPSTKAEARDNLELGDVATQDIVPISMGGTGATTAAQALLNLGAAGRLLNVQVFVASGTYTPTAGTTTVIVECVGGGGAGGGANATPAGEISVGCGGGSGAHTLARFAHTTSQTITVGAGGAGVSAGDGLAGTASSFGALVTAPGGNGGQRVLSGVNLRNGGGNGGVSGIGGNLYTLPGTPGSPVLQTQPNSLGVAGAAGPFGGGSGVTANGNGVNGVGFGSGGGGAANDPSNATLRTGGNGAAGVVIVYEYT